jgi:hypothetical protein
MNYCTVFGVPYKYTEEGLFVEINGRIYCLELPVAIPADFKALTLCGPNLVDIGGIVYVMIVDSVFMYKVQDLRYLSGQFIGRSESRGIYVVGANGKPDRAVAVAAWQKACPITDLSAINYFGVSAYVNTKKNRFTIYTEGRKNFIMELSHTLLPDEDHNFAN